MNHKEQIEGVPVSEEEVSKGLGFESIIEFRRWQTEVGNENNELKYAVKKAKDEGEGFRWHLIRTQFILKKVEEFLKTLKDSPDQNLVSKLILASEVVTGRGCDWDNILKDWFDECQNEINVRAAKIAAFRNQSQ
jgi:hypothetical protein